MIEKNCKINFIRLLFQELIIILLLGGVPFLVSFINGGIKETKVIVNALLANHFVFSYSVWLLVIFIFIKFIKKNFMHSNKRERYLNFIYEIFSQVENSVHVIIRTASGVTFMFILMWYFVEPSSISTENISYIVVIFSCLFIISYAFAIFDKIYIKDYQ